MAAVAKNGEVTPMRRKEGHGAVQAPAKSGAELSASCRRAAQGSTTVESVVCGLWRSLRRAGSREKGCAD